MRNCGVLSRKAGAARSKGRHVALPLPAQPRRRSGRPACPKVLATSIRVSFRPCYILSTACAMIADSMMLLLKGGLPHLAKQHSANATLATVTVVGRNGMTIRAAVDSRRAACAA